MGRRREVRLVADAASRIEAHGRGRQEGAQVERQVAGHAVVGGDDQRGAVAEPAPIRAAQRSGTGAGTTTRTPAAALRPPPARGARRHRPEGLCVGVFSAWGTTKDTTKGRTGASGESQGHLTETPLPRIGSPRDEQGRQGEGSHRDRRRARGDRRGGVPGAEPLRAAVRPRPRRQPAGLLPGPAVRSPRRGARRRRAPQPAQAEGRVGGRRDGVRRGRCRRGRAGRHARHAAAGVGRDGHRHRGFLRAHQRLAACRANAAQRPRTRARAGARSRPRRARSAAARRSGAL